MKRETFIKLSSTLMAAPLIFPIKNLAQHDKLMNWAGNLEYSSSNIYYPKSVEDLQKLINKCSKLKALGNDIDQQQFLQYTVPANCWFASKPASGSSFCLVGCTVAPGFDFADFEIADYPMLSNKYPQHETIIKGLCR